MPQPGTWEGTRVGRVTVLPMLLAGVLPGGVPGALSACVQHLCTQQAEGGADVWALEYSKVRW